jgi:ABC-2 type transport system permease protein
MKHLADKIKKYAKIWKICLYGGLMRRLAFRFNFVLMVMGVFLQMVLVLIFIKVIFGFINNLAGWSFNQALMVVASYMLVEGLMWATCAYLGGISENIKQGTLDSLLVKPVGTQFLASVQRADPEDWARVVTAIIIFIYGFKNLGLSGFDLFINIIFYIVLIFSAYVIIYSITLIVKSISFWVIESGSLWFIIENINQMSKYPTDIFFHKIARIIFSTVIPLAFIATVPAKILIHGPRIDLIAYSFCLAFVFFIVSRKFWLFGLRHYSSASS